MRTLFFTVASNQYSSITPLMIKSFLKYNFNSSFTILYFRNLNIFDKIINEKISYIDTNYLIDNRFGYIQNCDSKKTKWLKSQIYNYINKETIDNIAYVDSDILFFGNIESYMNEILSKDMTKIYFSTDRNLVLNTGFWFANINNSPILDMLKMWEESMSSILNNKEVLKTKYKKYFDQPILNDILNQNSYIKNSVVLLPKDIISRKNKTNNSKLCHYLHSRLRKMEIDYINFIK